MAMGTQRARQKQEDLFYANEQAEAPGHPFYQQLNGVLEQAKFDAFCEQCCGRFYHSKTGPAIARRACISGCCHQYGTGGLRRVHLRGRANVAKRVLLQAAAFNLALILPSLTKAGTPRGLVDLNAALSGALERLLAALPPLDTRPLGQRHLFRGEIFTTL